MAKRPRRRQGTLSGCRYVATRNTKREAKKLKTALNRDGFRSRVAKTYGGARLAYSVFSCGRLKNR